MLSQQAESALVEMLDFYVSKLGWWLIPCHHLDKRPIRAHKDWSRAPTAELLMTFRDAYRFRTGGLEPNWAVRCDKSNLVVLDIDQHTADADGVVSLWRAENEVGEPLPATWEDSRNHRFFAAPPGSENWRTHKFLDLPGLDFKCGRTIVVIPPSMHKSGAPYAWQPGRSPRDQDRLPLAQLPEWVIKEVAAKYAERPKRTISQPTPQPAATRRVAGSTGANRPTWTPAERATAYASRVAPAIEGQAGRAHTLSLTWNILRGFDLSVPAALDAVQAWNQTCLPPWTDADLYKMLADADAKSGERGWLLADRDMRDAVAQFGPALDIPVRPTPADQAAALAAELSSLPTLTEHVNERDAAVEKAAAAECRAVEQREHRPPATTCHCHGFLYHPERRQVRAARFACGRWCCVRCSRALKELWAPHLEKKILETRPTSPGDAAVFLHAATLELTKRRWGTIRRSLNRHGADFARISTGEPNWYLIIATRPFAGSSSSLVAQTARSVVSTVRTLAVYGDTRKPIHTSIGWRLPKEKPSGWKYVGSLNARATKSQIVNAVEAETGTEARQRVNKGNPFFVWAADAPVIIPPDQLAEDNWGSFVSRIHQRVSLRLNGDDPDIADMMAAGDIGLTCRLPLLE